MSLDLWDLPTYGGSDSESGFESEVEGNPFEEEFLLPFQEGGAFSYSDPYVLYTQTEFKDTAGPAAMERSKVHASTETEVLLRRPIVLVNADISQIQNTKGTEKTTAREKTFETMDECLISGLPITGMSVYATLKYLMELNKPETTKRDMTFERSLFTEEAKPASQTGGVYPSEKNPVGLANGGGKCYFNTYLQMLYCIDEVREAIVKFDPEVEPYKSRVVEAKDFMEGTSKVITDEDAKKRLNEILTVFKHVFEKLSGKEDKQNYNHEDEYIQILPYIFHDPKQYQDSRQLHQKLFSTIIAYLNLGRLFSIERKEDIGCVENKDKVFEPLSSHSFDSIRISQCTRESLQEELDSLLTEEIREKVDCLPTEDQKKTHQIASQQRFENYMKKSVADMKQVEFDKEYVESLANNSGTAKDMDFFELYKRGYKIKDSVKDEIIQQIKQAFARYQRDLKFGKATSNISYIPSKYVFIELEKGTPGGPEGDAIFSPENAKNTLINKEITMGGKTYVRVAGANYTSEPEHWFLDVYNKEGIPYARLNDNSITTSQQGDWQKATNGNEFRYNNGEGMYDDRNKSFLLYVQKGGVEASPPAVSTAKSLTAPPARSSAPQGATSTPEDILKWEVIPQKQYAVMAMFHGILAAAVADYYTLVDPKDDQKVPDFNIDLLEKYEWVANHVAKLEVKLFGIDMKHWNETWVTIQKEFLLLEDTIPFEEFCQMLQDPVELQRYIRVWKKGASFEERMTYIENLNKHSVYDSKLEDPQKPDKGAVGAPFIGPQRGGSRRKRRGSRKRTRAH